MSRIYFIDSENVGDNWISLLNSSASDDEILVFYTLKSPHMNYRNLILLKNSPKDVTFIECCEGNNALDFQLSTELGFRLSHIGDDEFIIVSNDNGYEAVVRYWKQKGYAVSRLKGKACASVNETVTETPAADLCPAEEKNAPADKSPAAALPPAAPLPVPAPEVKTGTSPAESQPVIDENAKEILYLVGKSDLQALHEALQQLYGTKKATSIYNAFKTDTAYNLFLSKHPKLNPVEKQEQYCMIVFAITSPNEPMPEDFPKYLMEAWGKKKNLNSLRSSLQQKYGKEKSNIYYSLIKVHMKILDKIK